MAGAGGGAAKMVAKQRIRMANEKHSKNITQRGNVAKTSVRRASDPHVSQPGPRPVPYGRVFPNQVDWGSPRLRPACRVAGPGAVGAGAWPLGN